MTSPSSHAVLSPSSAHRWLACPASVGLVASMPERAEETSAYAREGTLAHEAAEKSAAFFFGQLPKDELTRWVNAFAPDVGDRDEMLEHARAWTQVLARFEEDMGGAQVLLEQRFETGVPNCRGTADAVLVSNDTVHVCDYKYGQGVKVNAAGNPQMMLYALGALDAFSLVSEIKHVAMTIYQPRIEHLSTAHLSASDLLAWREEITPVAEVALAGGGDFAPSESACRFCPAQAVCRPRMEAALSEDFGKPANLLEMDEIGDLLHRIPAIKRWCADVEKYALKSAYEDGVAVPGWKPVIGKGQRKINPDRWLAAVAQLQEEGVDAMRITRTMPETLGTLKKVLGAERMARLEDDGVIVIPPGQPKLVPEIAPGIPTDRNSSARSDFEVPF